MPKAEQAFSRSGNDVLYKNCQSPSLLLSDYEGSLYGLAKQGNLPRKSPVCLSYDSIAGEISLVKQ